MCYGYLVKLSSKLPASDFKACMVRLGDLMRLDDLSAQDIRTPLEVLTNTADLRSELQTLLQSGPVRLYMQEARAALTQISVDAGVAAGRLGPPCERPRISTANPCRFALAASIS